MADCVLKGFILEDFPRTWKEAQELTKFCVPNYVFYVNTPLEKIISNTSNKTSEFMFDRRNFSKQIMKHLQEAPSVIGYYQQYYDNVRFIKGLKTSWYIEDFCLNQLMGSLEDWMSYAWRILYTQHVVKMENLTFERQLINQNQGFKGYCPVTWKLERKLRKCNYNSKTCVKYMNRFYFFADFEKWNLFIGTPTWFIDETVFRNEHLPV